MAVVVAVLPVLVPVLVLVLVSVSVLVAVLVSVSVLVPGPVLVSVLVPMQKQRKQQKKRTVICRCLNVLVSFYLAWLDTAALYLALLQC